MKTKIYFIISSILQIIAAVYTIISADTLVKTQLDSIKETYSMFPIEFQERVISLFENNGTLFFIILSSIGIVLNVMILIYALKTKLQEKRNMIIGLSIASFITSGTTIGTLLSIINVIIPLTSKDKYREAKTKQEKKEIPKLEKKKYNKKDIILGIILLVAYFSQFIWADFLPNSQNALLIANIIFNIVMLILSILFFYKELKTDIKPFKENIKEYISYILPKLGIMYLIYIVCSLITVLISQQGTSVNQEALEAIPKWFMIPTAIIWAPIVEEILFRGVLRRLIKNNKIFIIVSALIFGLLHTTSETTILNVFVMAIPYSILGGFFAYIYVKTNNLFSSISCHALQNTFATLMSLLIM